jgi:hypothetical protein
MGVTRGDKEERRVLGIPRPVPIMSSYWVHYRFSFVRKNCNHWDGSVSCSVTHVRTFSSFSDFSQSITDYHDGSSIPHDLLCIIIYALATCHFCETILFEANCL